MNKRNFNSITTTTPPKPIVTPRTLNGSPVPSCNNRNGIVVPSSASPNMSPVVAASVGGGKEFNDSKKMWDAFREMLGKRRALGLSIPSPGGASTGNTVVAPVHEDAWEYNMKHKKRGKAIIFNHKDYDPKLELSTRTGTEVDRDKLNDCLTLLGFQVQIYNDLSFEDLTKTIDSVAKEDHKDSDCLMIIVLTHGKTDLLYAQDMSYNPEILWSPFTGEKCSGLAGKPKMYFIQACRGEKYDDGTQLQVKRSRLAVDNRKKCFKVPNEADFLIVFSCVRGYYSWRNHIRGSWFIQALCKIFGRYHEHVDVLSMLTLVNQEVAMHYESNRPDDISQHGKKQVPNVKHTVTRQIFFIPKKMSAALINSSPPGSWV